LNKTGHSPTTLTLTRVVEDGKILEAAEKTIGRLN
jgi:hypothetical protein